MRSSCCNQKLHRQKQITVVRGVVHRVMKLAVGSRTKKLVFLAGKTFAHCQIWHQIEKIDLKWCFDTFEYLCRRVTSGGNSCVIVTVYRCGSRAITEQFCIDFTNLLELVLAYTEAVVIMVDINFHLDKLKNQLPF